MLDICIIGAPKCGTSSLFRWLTAHPEISGPKKGKELFFFMDSGHPLAKEPNVNTVPAVYYSSLFPEGSSRTVEGTTHYLFQQTARRYLSSMKSEPIIVTLLRDPAHRVWSSYRYTKNNLARVDPSLSFARYVRLSLNGEAERISNFVSDPGSAHVLSRDVEYSKYVKYLTSWKQCLSHDRLLLFQFSNLVEDPKSLCSRLVSAVGVGTSFFSNFRFNTKNSTYETKSSYLHSLARQVARWMPDGKIKKYVKQAYMGVATSESVSASEEDKQALRRLREYYRPYNQRLSREFGIDVSSWK